MKDSADRLFTRGRGETETRRLIWYGSRETGLDIPRDRTLELFGTTVAPKAPETHRTVFTAHAGYDHSPTPTHQGPIERRRLSPKERREHVLKILKDWRTYAGLSLFILDWATHHLLDAVLAPLLALFGSATLDDLVILWWINSLRSLEAAWRGYEAPKKGTPYQGEGHPDSPVTYAVENLRGAYNEGVGKKLVSGAVLVGTAIGYPIDGAWQEGAKVVKWIWKRRKSDWSHFIPRWIEKGATTVVAAPIIVGAALWGAAKGLARWGKEVWDGRKLKNPKTVPA